MYDTENFYYNEPDEFNELAESEDEMKEIEKLMISVASDFADDYGLEGLFDELFPGMSAGEIVLDMYNSGLIPDDVMDRFLNDSE